MLNVRTTKSRVNQGLVQCFYSQTMISANALSYQQFAEVAMWKLFKVQYVKKGGILLWIKLHKRKLIKNELAWKFKTYKCAFLLSSQIHWERDFFYELLILKLFCYLSNLNIQCYHSNTCSTQKFTRSFFQPKLQCETNSNAANHKIWQKYHTNGLLSP